MVEIERSDRAVKGANIFVDVDLTLVDSQGRLMEGAREALQRLKDKNCHLFLWSTAGAEYARAVAARYKLDGLFDAFAAKPDIIIDDTPSTALNPFVFNPNDQVSWQRMAENILNAHID